jgi:hypothetical protein
MTLSVYQAAAFVVRVSVDVYSLQGSLYNLREAARLCGRRRIEEPTPHMRGGHRQAVAALGPVTRTMHTGVVGRARGWSVAARRAEERGACARVGTGGEQRRQSGGLALGLSAITPSLSSRSAVEAQGSAASRWGLEGRFGSQREQRLGSGLQLHRSHTSLVRLGANATAPEPVADVVEHTPEVGRLLRSCAVGVPRLDACVLCVRPTKSSFRPKERSLCNGEDVGRSGFGWGVQDIEHMQQAYDQALMAYQRAEVRSTTTSHPAAGTHAVPDR